MGIDAINISSSFKPQELTSHVLESSCANRILKVHQYNCTQNCNLQNGIAGL